MMKKMLSNTKGQTLVIFALALAGLIAMAALIIDGGGMYVNRRQAQTAADAAAMAGAYELCFKQGNLNTVTNVVNNYAMTQNNATSVDSVSIDANAKTVSVGTTVSSQSFFAVILGQENNVASAEATAGCFTPAAYKGVLPVAWTCRPAVNEPFDDDCYLHQVPWNIFQTVYTNKPAFQGQKGTILSQGDEVNPTSYLDSLNPKKMIYIIMDSTEFDVYATCYDINLDPNNPIGEIKCDFDGDGISDIYGGANRGWLYLDGEPKPGASSLENIIYYGFNSPVVIPQWFQGKDGVSTSVFDALNDRVGDLVLVPIYDAMCDSTRGDQIPSNCSDVYQAGDLINPATATNSGTFYRVAGFAPFVITCVSTGQSDKCPGKEIAGIKHNVKTAEGYFISGVSTGTDIGSGAGLDLGVYLISLRP